MNNNKDKTKNILYFIFPSEKSQIYIYDDI